MKSMLRMTTAVIASLLVHTLVLNAARLMPALPESDWSLDTPIEVELGFVDSSPSESANLPGAPSAPVEAANAAAAQPLETSTTDPNEEKQMPSDASVTAELVADGGVDAAQAQADAHVAESADATDAGPVDGGASPEPLPAPLVASQHGAQVSLRVDLAALRASPYAELVGTLIAQSADVQAILAGSEIDPMRDLDRLWVASPDLTREHSVIAGQYHGGTKIAVAAAKRLADSHGSQVRFRPRGPFQVAPWHSPDPTPRVVALLGSETFVIARDTDLEAVLAIAQRLTSPAKSDPHAADRLGRGLLNLGSGILAQLDVENVSNFVRDRSGAPPQRLAAQVIATPKTPGMVIRAVGTFASAEEAKTTRERLRELQKRYSTHPLVMLLGFSRLIRQCELSLQGPTLSLRAEATDNEVRDQAAVLAPPAARPNAAPPPNAPATTLPRTLTPTTPPRP